MSRKKPAPYKLPSAGRAFSPTSAEVEAHILAVEKRHPKLVTVRQAGRSQEGRPVWAVTVNDPSVPGDDKQHAMVVGGRHGNEESGRLIALTLLDWLVGAGRRTLRKQTVVIMPNCNPDACERDIYKPLNGMQTCYDWGKKGEIPETRAFRETAEPFVPDLFVDLHSKGGCGCSTDMVLYPSTKSYTEDDNLFHELALEACAAGERAGIPHMTHPLSWWDGDKPAGACHECYQRFHCISMLTETSESNKYSYPAADRAKAGLARLVAMLAWGERRHFGCYYAGYPCYIACGMFQSGVAALGRTAAQRRVSRLAIWRSVHAFKSCRAEIPEKWKEKRVVLEYAGKRIREGVGVQFTVRGHLKIVSIRLNGKRLKPSETEGYTTWRDGAATFVVAAIPDLKRGKHVVEARFG
jgi:predicted deacylase